LNLIAAIKTGDESVFEKVYSLHHEKLYFYILKKTTSTYLAEEVVQLTYIKLWNYRERLSEEIPLEVQLFRIAKTTLIDLLRKNANQRMMLQQYSDIIPVGNENVISSLVRKETSERINAIVETLPPVRKKVFQLSRESGLTHKEIAEKLSLTTKNVENHIAKAIKQIRKALQTLFIIAVLLLLIFVNK
jgi:RNA polymerase sigma-70 factor (ECF subfamily)